MRAGTALCGTSGVGEDTKQEEGAQTVLRHGPEEGRTGAGPQGAVTLLKGSRPVSWVPSMTMRPTQNSRRSLPVSKSDRG